MFAVLIIRLTGLISLWLLIYDSSVRVHLFTSSAKGKGRFVRSHRWKYVNFYFNISAR